MRRPREHIFQMNVVSIVVVRERDELVPDRIAELREASAHAPRDRERPATLRTLCCDPHDRRTEGMGDLLLWNKGYFLDPTIPLELVE